MNWLDRVIAFVNPQAAIRRQRARLAVDAMDRISARKYEGAAKGRRIDGWLTQSTSANAEISTALATLRDRSRDLVRNNPYAARAIQAISANTVGTGIVPQAKHKKPKPAQMAMDAWRVWGETTQCDADGNLDFYGLQALAMRTVAESGECLIRQRRSQDPKLAIPLQLQLLEADFVDSSKEGDLESGGYIIQGVEFDRFGKRVAYYLFTKHPGDKAASKVSVRVPAEEIIHLYRKDRPGQVRGVPWSAPVIVRLHDFDEYEDAQLVRQKIAACYTAFVQDIETPLDSTAAESVLGERLEPGSIELLPPGKTITLANPPTVTGYNEYASAVLHAVAAGYGVTYEMLTGDFSQVNFSSGRMGWLEFNRNIELWRWSMLIPQFCNTVWAWFIEAAMLKGFSVEGVEATWTPPRREMIDPTREVPATIKAIRGGLMSLSQSIRENGYDPKTHLEEMKADFDLLDKLGLKLDSDPRNITAGGMVQPEVAPKPEASSNEE